jgi:hypothetical protein
MEQFSNSPIAEIDRTGREITISFGIQCVCDLRIPAVHRTGGEISNSQDC